MAVVPRVVLLRRGFLVLNAQRVAVSAQSRTMGTTKAPAPWHYIWKPGPYPVTQEARDAAAKKYGLIPEDYEPYPNDGDGAGDYPKIKPVHMDARDGLYDWDSPELKRNYNEPLYLQHEMLLADRSDMFTRKRYTVLQFVGFFFLGLAALMSPVYLLNRYGIRYFPAVTEKVYLKDGPRYTFETVE